MNHLSYFNFRLFVVSQKSVLNQNLTFHGRSLRILLLQVYYSTTEGKMQSGGEFLPFAQMERIIFVQKRKNRPSLCTIFGNIPFPLAERSCLDCEEYFGTAEIEFQFTANCARRSAILSYFLFACYLHTLRQNIRGKVTGIAGAVRLDLVSDGGDLL